MATGGFALEGTVGSFEHANGEATESAIPIIALEASFGSATSAAFESVIKGPTVGRHDRVFARIDQRFKDLLSTGRLHEERFFVTRAQQHWSRAKAVVEMVLTLAPAERFTSGLNLLQQYKHEIDTASAALVRRGASLRGRHPTGAGLRQRGPWPGGEDAGGDVRPRPDRRVSC